jgi:hypothetical protein
VCRYLWIRLAFKAFVSAMLVTNTPGCLQAARMCALKSAVNRCLVVGGILFIYFKCPLCNRWTPTLNNFSYMKR